MKNPSTIKKSSKKERVVRKIPLHSAMWANIYNYLIENNVKFPKGWNGIGVAYGGLCIVDDTLKEYKVSTPYSLPAKRK